MAHAVFGLLNVGDDWAFMQISFDARLRASSSESTTGALFRLRNHRELRIYAATFSVRQRFRSSWDLNLHVLKVNRLRLRSAKTGVLWSGPLLLRAAPERQSPRCRLRIRPSSHEPIWELPFVRGRMFLLKSNKFVNAQSSEAGS